MKKKIVAAVAACAALALSACLLAGCSSSSSSASASASASASGSASAAATKFVVGFDAEYPPYGFMGDDGKPAGFDLDLATEVAKRNNWTIELQAIDWDAKDAVVDSGAITCIWNGFAREGREDQYTFSNDYMRNAQVIVVKADSGLQVPRRSGWQERRYPGRLRCARGSAGRPCRSGCNLWLPGRAG